MKKITHAMIPFGIYAFFVLLFKFLTLYLFPKFEMVLTFYFFLSLYGLYLYIGTFLFGFALGKITLKRFAYPHIGYCILFAIFSYVVMLVLGGFNGIFREMSLSLHPNIGMNDFFWGLSHPETDFNSKGTLFSFFLGEFYEYFLIRKNKKGGEIE